MRGTPNARPSDKAMVILFSSKRTLTALISEELIPCSFNSLSELKEHGMSSSLIKAVNVRFDENSMTIALSDGRALGVPLAWFPRLLHASQAQRMQYRISTRGLHWEALDEDISLAGLLAGYGDMTRRPAQAA